jgi:hypothetical protein
MASQSFPAPPGEVLVGGWASMGSFAAPFLGKAGRGLGQVIGGTSVGYGWHGSGHLPHRRS